MIGWTDEWMKSYQNLKKNVKVNPAVERMNGWNILNFNLVEYMIGWMDEWMKSYQNLKKKCQTKPTGWTDERLKYFEL